MPFLNVLIAGRDGPVGSKNHVHDMVLRGAQLTTREADTVIQYLVTNFRPAAPAATAVALPSGPARKWSKAAARYATRWSGSPS